MYQAKNVTPYVHALANHVLEFLRLYGSLVPYNIDNIVCGVDRKRTSNTEKYAEVAIAVLVTVLKGHLQTIFSTDIMSL